MRRVRRDRGQVLEARAPVLLGRLLAVDLLDADEGAVALAAPRLARRPADLVADAKLAAADLGGGDVDVVLAGLEAGEAEEAVALGKDVEHARDLLGRPVGCLLPLIVAVAVVTVAVTAVVSTAAAAAAAPATPAAPSGLLGVIALLRPLRLLRLLGRLDARLVEALDQLIAAQQPVPGHAGARREGVEFGQMPVGEVASCHAVAQDNVGLAARRSQPRGGPVRSASPRGGAAVRSRSHSPNSGRDSQSLRNSRRPTSVSGWSSI